MNDDSRKALLIARGLVGFTSWDAVRVAASLGDDLACLYYWAPLDRHPVRVHVRAVFKNGGVRVSPGMRGASAFTADAGHLDRFFSSMTGAERFAREAAEAVDKALVALACVEGEAERSGNASLRAEAKACASRLRNAGAWRIVEALGLVRAVGGAR